MGTSVTVGKTGISAFKDHQVILSPSLSMSLNAHPLHPAFAAEFGPVHWVFGSTFMTKLGPLDGEVHLVVIFHLVPKRRREGEENSQSVWH